MEKRKKGKRSNCLIFALQKWFTEGGYLVIRKSRYGWWPHFIWCRDLKGAEIEQFVPIRAKPEYKIYDALLFEGKIKRKD